MAQNAEQLRALKLTVPVMCGYLFLGVAFGATLAQAGYGAACAGSCLLLLGPDRFLAPALALTAAFLLMMTRTPEKGKEAAR